MFNFLYCNKAAANETCGPYRDRRLIIPNIFFYDQV